MRFLTKMALSLVLLAPAAQAQELATIVFRNATDVPQVFSVDGRVVCFVPRWKDCPVTVSVGIHELIAAYEANWGNPPLKVHVDMKAGQTWTWLVQIPKTAAKAEDQTMVVATNESEWPAFIYVDNEPLCYVSETRGASCKGSVSPGSHKLEAYVGSEVIASKSITVKAGDTYLWTVRIK